MKSSDRRGLAIIVVSTIVSAALFPLAASSAASEVSAASQCRRYSHGEEGSRRCGGEISSSDQIAQEDASESRCVAEGLRSLPVFLRATVVSREAGRVNSPKAIVVWSGSPLPEQCDARVSASFDIRLRFEGLGGPPLDLGAGPDGWQVFWSGYGRVHRARKVYGGPTFAAPIGCITMSRGWVRYRVIGGGGEVLAQRVQKVPVRHPPCDK
jgi:hypothetical protein